MADKLGRMAKLRNASVSPTEGKNPTENPGIMPGATKETPAQKETNVTSQYWEGKGAGSGPWGGQAKDE